jgi:hypothetical protein
MGQIRVKKELRVKTLKRSAVAADLIFLIALFWIVRYWHSLHFGLYEDDLTIIPDAFVRSFSSLISYISFYITHLHGHARPLSNSFIYLFSWVGWHIAGLWGPYLIGYLITITNIGLFHRLMCRTTNRPFALIAGLGYVLYSADTTQSFLTHSLGVQPSITLILLACHSYLSGRRIPAYLLAFLVLFSYETPFLVFLAVPLFKKEWNRYLLKEFLLHGLILGVMLGSIYLLRISVGEGRVEGLGLPQAVAIAAAHMLEGPAISLGTYAYRPIQTIRAFNFETALAVVPAFFIFLWITSRLPATAKVIVRDLWRAIRDPSMRSSLPEELTLLGRTAVAGLVMLVMAYPLTFTVRAYALSGRDTRVHTAGVVGAAILLASAIFLLIQIVSSRRIWRWFTNGIIALALSLLAGYGFVIQHDYVLAWQYQREFWTELLPLIQDANSTTYVLVTSDTLKDTQQIDANKWSLPNVLGQLYEFPSLQTPRVFRLRPGWQDHLEKSAAIFISGVTSYVAPDFYEKADFPNIILIDTSPGKMVRRTGPLEVDGQPYSIKQPSDPVLTALKHGLLYNLMVIEPR